MFVSHRREDVPSATRFLADSLIERLGKDHVVLDFDIGAPVTEVIGDRVARCDVLLAIIGHSWLGERDSNGRRRLDDPEDYVRLEVEAALQGNILVVPVLVDGARLPRPSDLPESLKPLLRWSAAELSLAHWDLDVDKLIAELGRIAVERSRTEASAREHPEREQAREDADARQQVERGAASKEWVERDAAEPEQAEKRQTGPQHAESKPQRAESWPRVKQQLEAGRDDSPEMTEAEAQSLDAYLTGGTELAGAEPTAGAKRLARMVAAVSRGDGGSQADVVDCTVFAPAVAVPGTLVNVQAYLHAPSQAADALALAQEFDPGTSRRGFRGLQVPIPGGAVVDVELDMPGLTVRDPVQRLAWRGRAEAIQFAVNIPAKYPVGASAGLIIVRRAGIPVGRVGFQIAIEARPPRWRRRKWQRLSANEIPQGEQPVRFTTAFISYASDDRADVLLRTQVLAAARIRYFQDLLSLDPGERWEAEIYRYIDDCDLFLLFWSQAAKNSEWVRREAGYALERQTSAASHLPEIRPVILGHPPVQLPWPELEHLHFNDRLIYLMGS